MLAVRLIFITGRWRAWILIAAAMGFMAIRRSITYYRITVEDVSLPSDFSAEIVTLLISMLMVSGVLMIGPAFRRIQRTRDELRESREILKNLLDHSPSIITIRDTAQRYQLVNRAYEDRSGLTNEVIRGKHIKDVLPDDYAEEIIKYDQTVIESGEPMVHEHSAALKRNDDRMLSARFPIKDDKGEIVAVGSIGTDISEMRRTEETLREVERRYQAVVQDQTEMISRHKPDGTRTFVNDSYCRFHGKTAEQLIGQSAYEGMAEDDLKRLKTLYKTLTPDQPIGDYKIGFAGPDGKTIWQHWTKRAIYGETGQVSEYQSVGRDITKHRQAEVLNERLGRIVERSLNEIYVFDAVTLRFLQVNFGARSNLDYSMTELRELTPPDIKPEFTRETFEQVLKPLRDGREEKVTFETVHRRKDGSTYDVETYLQLMQEETPEVFVAIIRDISEQKEAERMINEALTEAEMANRAKSEFLATMSHEFRTPLNAILGFSEMLRAQYFGPLGAENYREYASDIHNSGAHMLALVNDILDISAIEAGKRGLDIEAINVEDLLKDCLRNFEMAANNSAIQLSLEVPERLSDFHADRRSIAQIVQNLLSNAIKSVDRDGVISVSALQEGEDLVIRVKDTGVGIPPDKLSAITEPFVQADPNPHRAQKGTGLGLSIVKSLVEVHRGQLDIESDVGQGATVTVTFPLRSA